jgi:hypothetical protein
LVERRFRGVEGVRNGISGLGSGVEADGLWAVRGHLEVEGKELSIEEVEGRLDEG